MSGRGWFATPNGDRLHAVIGSRALCGIERASWLPLEGLRVCENCRSTCGVAFPAPPGGRHSQADVPWFGDYANQRAGERV